MDLIIAWIVLIILVTHLVGGVLYLAFGWFKWMYHDLMEWHKPTDERSFDGCSYHSVCKYCGKEIMQDSQGNWF